MCLEPWSELGWVDPNALTAEFKESDPDQFIGDLSDEGDVPADDDCLATRRSNRLRGIQPPFSLSRITVCSNMSMIYVQQFFGSAVYRGCCGYRNAVRFLIFAGGLRYLPYRTATFLNYVTSTPCTPLGRLSLGITFFNYA